MPKQKQMFPYFTVLIDNYIKDQWYMKKKVVQNPLVTLAEFLYFMRLLTSRQNNLPIISKLWDSLDAKRDRSIT